VEILQLARANALRAGVDGSESVEGHLEEIPLGNGGVDVVICNSVINLRWEGPAAPARVAWALAPEVVSSPPRWRPIP
jgi:arsenite methyltransferase